MYHLMVLNTFYNSYLLVSLCELAVSEAYGAESGYLDTRVILDLSRYVFDFNETLTEYSHNTC